MAYSKQTWTDDVSAVTGARMTHIEQGIYDNSLATDKINPSGTATTTAEIEAGQINDVIGFKSLKLKGQTSQISYNGYNILNGIIENRTTNGVTITKNEDNSYKVSGTATAVALFSTNINTTLEASKTYVIGFGNSNSNVQLSIRPSDGSTQYANTTTQKYVTYTPNENIDIRLFVRVANGATVNETIYPIIYVGNTEKSYEPYVGGKASPNPDYPQDVNNVSGDNVIGISNKNLIEYSFKGYNITSQGKFETGGTSLDFDVHIAKVKAGMTYKITPATNVIAYFDERPTITSQAYNNAREVITSTNTLTPTRSGYIAMRTATSNTAQLEKGTSATSYIAHQGNNFEINLGKNLFNKENIINGKRLTNDPLNQLTDAEGYYTSSFIKVNPNTTYTKNSPLADAFHRFAFYSSNSESGYLSITNENTIVTPSECKYVRFSGKMDELDTTQLEKGNATSYAPYFPPIEICQIGTYQDYIYKKDGKWFVHKEFEKLTLKDMNWFLADNTGLSNTVSHRWAINHPCSRITNNNMQVTMSNILPMGSANITWGQDVLSIGQSMSQVVIRMPVEYTTAEAMKTALAETNAVGYALLGTPIEEEITYTPLIRQLDELYNSGLYDNTNISQDNSSEAFILDIEACKNNINGIVEYIRR